MKHIEEYYKTGDLKGTLELINEALEKEPQNTQALYWKAKLFFKQGSIDTQTIMKLFDGITDDNYTLISKAEMLRRQGRYKEALKQLNTIDPSFKDTTYLKGICTLMLYKETKQQEYLNQTHQHLKDLPFEFYTATNLLIVQSLLGMLDQELLEKTSNYLKEKIAKYPQKATLHLYYCIIQYLEGKSNYLTTLTSQKLNQIPQDILQSCVERLELLKVPKEDIKEVVKWGQQDQEN